MAELTTLNLRGIRISPEVKEDAIHYYACLIDLPSNNSNPNPGSYGMFTMIPANEGDTTLNFQYNGTLADPQPGDTIATYLVGVYTDQKIAKPNGEGPNGGDNLTVVLTDNTPASAGGPNYVKGVPNYGRPPVIKMIDRTILDSPANIVLQSATYPDNYFVVTMMNTYLGPNITEGPTFTNVLVLTPTINDGVQSLMIAMMTKEENVTDPKGVVAIGGNPSSLGQFATSYYDSTNPGNIDYTDLKTF